MSAEQFKTARKSLGMSQTELADKLGVSRETVSNWERSNPPAVAVLALASLTADQDATNDKRAIAALETIQAAIDAAKS